MDSEDPAKTVFNVKSKSSRYFSPQDLKRSEDLSCVSFGQPGLNLSNFDRNDYPTIKSLMQLNSLGETLVLGNDVNQTFYGYDWVANIGSFYTLSYEMNIAPLMYSHEVSKSYFTYKTSIKYIGRSSIVVESKHFVENSSEPILRTVHRFVSMNKESRKSEPLASFLREKGKDLLPLQLKKVEEFGRPESTFVTCVCVTWSDTDFNGHCNSSNFPRFAADGLHLAIRYRDSEMSNLKDCSLPFYQTNNSLPVDDDVKSGNQFALYRGNPSVALKGITKEIVDCGVKECRIHFFKECLEDDLLNVHIWQDGRNDSIVYCSIERNGQVAAQLVLEYFNYKSKL